MTRIKAIAFIIISALIMTIVAPASKVSANEEKQYFVLLCTKDNAACRESASQKAKVVRRAPYGSLLYAEREITNSAGNIWYLLHDGSWIFSGNCQVTGQIAPLPGTASHECYAAVKSILGSTYCATDKHSHYCCNTYQMLCTCGKTVTTGYDVVVEACDYNLSWSEGICEKCHNKESSVAVAANKVTNATSALATTFKEELANPEETLKKSGEALLLGDAAEEQTLTNAIGETIFSIVGIDAPCDARDLVVSVANFGKNAEEEGTLKALGAIGFSALCLLPVIGSVKSIKSIDKATDAIKATKKIDDITDAAKATIKSVEVAVDTGTTVVKAADTASDITKASDHAATAVTSIDKTVDKADAVKDTTSKTYQTYTKTNPTTGEVYSGRTSGTGSPLENIANRDANHHMNEKGFGPAQLDRTSDNYQAIRGREQMLIDYFGGAKSGGGSSGNAINGISPNNKNINEYIEAAKGVFGDIGK